MLKREITLLFSSDPANGAFARSENGDEFSVNLYNPVQISRNTKYCTLQVLSANVWYTTPNVATQYDNDIFVLSKEKKLSFCDKCITFYEIFLQII